MASIITVEELPTALQAVDMIDVLVAGANAQASRVAPCLADTTTPPTVDQLDEARLVLVGAVKRWAEAGAGALQSQTAGPFGLTVDTRQRTGWNLRPAEVTQLQAICKGEEAASAYVVDSSPVSTDWTPYTPLDTTSTWL